MIFEDHKGLRWRIFIIASVLLGIAFLVGLLLFISGIYIQPALPNLEDLPSFEALGATLIQLQEQGKASDRPVPLVLPSHPHQPLFQPGRLTRTAFVQSDSSTSIGDLKHHLEDLDVVFPNFFAWTGERTGITRNLTPEFFAALGGSTVSVMPLLSNADEKGSWHGKEVDALLADRTASDALIQSLVREFSAIRAAGINVDFETLSKNDRESYSGWLERLTREFHKHGMLVTVDVPPADPAYDYARIGTCVDGVVVMAYDEHYPTGEPGPVASTDWLKKNVEWIAGFIPPGHLVVGLGAYGYDWTDPSDGRPARSISFPEAMHLADAMDAGVDLDTVSQNEHFEFDEPDGAHHEVWLLDAVTCWDQLQSLRNLHLGGFALWRLGLEDQGVWGFLKTGNIQAFDPMRLSTVSATDVLLLSNGGEIFRIKNLEHDGTRKLELKQKEITYATYTKFPQYVSIEMRGHSDDKQIALTFDDGPDPRWTPKILDVLKKNQVPATFFLVGKRAATSPGIVQRELAEGHTLGNHTFCHPHLDKISTFRINWEINQSQRAIEGVTGLQTTLFRAPFYTDSPPLDKGQIAPLFQICSHHYYIVGADIDSEDTTMPPTQKMIHTILSRLEETGSNIIVFHDFGFNRSHSLEALEYLIPYLKSQGYTFVTVNQLMGFSRDYVMPKAPQSERLFLHFSKVMSWYAIHVFPMTGVLMWIVSGLAIFRLTVLGGLIAHAHVKDRRHQKKETFFTPPVAVLIPAYNEETVIQRTIRKVLKSDYPNFTILVVDDGSTDQTADKVLEIAGEDSRVKLLRKRNAGKSESLNLGFQSVTEDYVVTIDADTLVHSYTLKYLMKPFADPGVDAVCGNVEVGNVRNLLTRFQDVEYVITQNYDRRAFEALNCITVVPGATGAWKRSSVLNIGGYADNTLTEDADLTIHLIASGGRILYAPMGKSVTEAPENLTSLYKQRFRWNFGMFQSLWKHRKNFGKGTLGCIAMPNIAAQLLLLLLAPFCDLLLLYSLLSGEIVEVAKASLFLLALEMISAIVAFRLDQRSLKSLWVVFIQRFFYRPFLYWVSINVVIAILKGGRHGWNKLQRTGHISETPNPGST